MSDEVERLVYAELNKLPVTLAVLDRLIAAEHAEQPPDPTTAKDYTALGAFLTARAAAATAQLIMDALTEDINETVNRERIAQQSARQPRPWPACK